MRFRLKKCLSNMKTRHFYAWAVIAGFAVRILVTLSLIGLVVAALIKYITS